MKGPVSPKIFLIGLLFLFSGFLSIEYTLEICSLLENVAESTTLTTCLKERNVFLKIGINQSQQIDFCSYNLKFVNKSQILPVQHQLQTDLTNVEDKTCELQNEQISNNTYEIIIGRDDNVRLNYTYEITLLFKSFDGYYEKNLTYTTPECIENTCACSDSYPVKLTSIVETSEQNYTITYLNTTGPINLERLFYKSMESNYELDIEIPQNNIMYDDEISEIYLNNMSDFVNGKRYEIFASFSMGNCKYDCPIQLSVPEYLVPESDYSLYYKIVIILITILVFLVSGLIGCMFIKRWNVLQKLKNLTHRDVLKGRLEKKTKEEYNAQYTPFEFSMPHNYDEYEIPRNKIVFKEEIGKGEFGKVFYAKAYNIQNEPGHRLVAVKQLKDGVFHDEIERFKEEIEMLKKIQHNGGHENIVKLLACITIQKPYAMIMELIPHGSLKDYLVKLKSDYSTGIQSTKFFPREMEENWRLEIPESSAAEPKHEKLHYITCSFKDSNLNISEETSGELEDMLTDTNPKQPRRKKIPYIQISPLSEKSSISEEITPTYKEISAYPTPKLNSRELQQFAYQIAKGMAFLETIPIIHRDLAARNILITENKVLKISDFGMSRMCPYVNKVKYQKKIPLRWMSIEAIENENYNLKSDVWSFGVVLWEIGTLGDFPYCSIPDILLLPKLKDGVRLHRPEICTNELYQVMQKCWSCNPDERPSFQTLVEILDMKKRKIYVDFQKIRKKYMYPPYVKS